RGGRARVVPDAVPGTHRGAGRLRDPGPEPRRADHGGDAVNVSILDWIAVLPALLVLAAGFLVVAVDLFAPPRRNQLALVLVSFAGLGGAAVLHLQRLQLARRPLAAFGGSVVLDDLTSMMS